MNHPPEAVDLLHPMRALTAELSGEVRSRLLNNLLETGELGILLAEGKPGEEVVVVVNERFCELYAVSFEEIYHRPLRVFLEGLRSRLSPDENPPHIIEALAARPPHHIEEEVVIAEPSLRYLHQSISPALSEDDTAFGILYLARDITYSKHLEDQALHSQKMESVGTLAGGIAHDFNNILTAVLGYASSLKEDLSGQPGLTRKLDQIIRSAHRAADLTRNLLAFSRKNPHIPEVLDFNQLVRDTAGVLEFAMPESISLKVDLAAGLPNVEGDRAQLQQVITHLAVNARDAIFGEGTISLTTRAGVDTQAGENAPRVEYVVLDVEDDGVGIPKGNLSRIFEPFYTTKETGKGVGLGLAMVYGALKQHYGFVEVESAPSLGSRFSIFIPATSKQIQPKGDRQRLPRTGGSNAQPGKVRAILIVDDEEDLRNLCVVALGELSNEIILAKDGLEAVEIFRERRRDIDLVILDLTMPVLSGSDCFMRLREMDPTVRVLISSGYSRDMGANELLKNGAAGFLEKPYTISSLVKTVQDLTSGV